MTVAQLDAQVDLPEFLQWKALWRVEQEERAEEWSQTDELLALSIEVNQEWLRTIALLTAGQKLRSLPGKVRIRRPSQPSDSRSDVAKAMSLFGEIGRG